MINVNKRSRNTFCLRGDCMDIFAAQLKRISSVPIRKNRAKINAPNKGSASKGVTEDLDHYENHGQYFELLEGSTKEAVSSEHPLEKNNSSNGHETGLLAGGDDASALEINDDVLKHEYTDSKVSPEFIAYAKKPRIPREELKQLEAAKKSLKHLDLFI